MYKVLRLMYVLKEMEEGAKKCGEQKAKGLEILVCAS